MHRLVVVFCNVLSMMEPCFCDLSSNFCGTHGHTTTGTALIQSQHPVMKRSVEDVSAVSVREARLPTLAHVHMNDYSAQQRNTTQAGRMTSAHRMPPATGRSLGKRQGVAIDKDTSSRWPSLSLLPPKALAQLSVIAGSGNLDTVIVSIFCILAASLIIIMCFAFSLQCLTHDDREQPQEFWTRDANAVTQDLKENPQNSLTRDITLALGDQDLPQDRSAIHTRYGKFGARPSSKPIEGDTAQPRWSGPPGLPMFPHAEPLSSQLQVPPGTECTLLVPFINYDPDKSPDDGSLSFQVKDTWGYDIFRMSLSWKNVRQRRRSSRRSSFSAFMKSGSQDLKPSDVFDLGPSERSIELTLDSVNGGVFAYARLVTSAHGTPSFTIEKQNHSLYGTLSLSENCADGSQFVFATPTNQRIHFFGDLRFNQLNAQADDQQLLAVARRISNERGQFQELVVGAAADAGLLVLCMVGIGWLREAAQDEKTGRSIASRWSSWFRPGHARSMNF